MRLENPRPAPGFQAHRPKAKPTENQNGPKRGRCIGEKAPWPPTYHLGELASGLAAQRRARRPGCCAGALEWLPDRGGRSAARGEPGKAGVMARIPIGLCGRKFVQEIGGHEEGRAECEAGVRETRVHVWARET